MKKQSKLSRVKQPRALKILQGTIIPKDLPSFIPQKTHIVEKIRRLDIREAIIEQDAKRIKNAYLPIE